MADKRSYVSGNFALELDGTKCGFVKSASGGAITAEVIDENVGADYFAHKHLGQVEYEDISVDIGLSMAKPVYEWIAASWEMKYQRKNGSIIACDFNHQAQSQRQFQLALLVETVIPALDASSKDAAYIRLKLSPELIRSAKGSGKVDVGAKQPSKMFLLSNFKLEIDGLDCTRVNKIDSFTVKQTVTHAAVGEMRDYEKEPGRIEFPNLKVTFAEASGESWRAWFEDFVIKGNNDKEKSGTISFLTPNHGGALASIKLFNLGIFKLTEGSADGKDHIHRMTAELYCERMQFIPPAGAA